jgi:hypothetical protein
MKENGAVSEKSTRNDVDYAAKPRMARHRAVLRWLMQFWLANSLPSNTISAIQSWKKEIPDRFKALAVRAVPPKSAAGATVSKYRGLRMMPRGLRGLQAGVQKKDWAGF